MPLPQTTSEPAPAANRLPKAPRFYRPELDVLRFFAFLAVFFVHGPGYTLGPHPTPAQTHTLRQFYLARETGVFGLDIFFLLSSYLITELLLRELQSTGSVHLPAFYTRRILRIWPLYYFVIGVGVLASTLVPEAQGLTHQQLLYLLFFVGWLGTGTYHNGAGVLWSISVEEWFYLIWPGIAKLGGSRSVFWASVFIIPVSLLAAVFAAEIWYNPFVQFLFFAVGALLALGLRGRSLVRLSIPLRFGMIAIAIALFRIAAAHIDEPSGHSTALASIGIFVLAAIGCVLIFLATLDAPRSLTPAPLVYLGKISYGLYVFHPFALVIVTRIFHSPQLGHHVVGRLVFMNAAALALTIAVAACSYHWFEKPILAFKERFAFIPSRKA